MPTVLAIPDVATVSADLRSLQRKRSIVMKSRNMQANRLQAIIAGTLGYYADMPEKERPKKFAEASALIASHRDLSVESEYADEIRATLAGIDAFENLKGLHEKEMKKTAAMLPVALWVAAPEQRGFGLLSLAVIIGETGDLHGYGSPAKVWRRMGCAPHTFDGKTQMGATWRGGKQGKLPAAEWDEFGYSPRRRSISFIVGEGLIKQNSTAGAEDAGGVEGEQGCETEATIATKPARVPGPYRLRYDESKAKLKANHPDYSDLRRHRHGMLLATKLLLKNLWIEWRRLG